MDFPTELLVSVLKSERLMSVGKVCVIMRSAAAADVQAACVYLSDNTRVFPLDWLLLDETLYVKMKWVIRCLKMTQPLTFFRIFQTTTVPCFAMPPLNQLLDLQIWTPQFNYSSLLEPDLHFPKKKHNNLFTVCSDLFLFRVKWSVV